MDRFRIGIIGYGGFGQFLHRSWDGLDGVQVVAVADELEAQNPGPPMRFFSRWEELVADPDIDVVSIVTPPGSHADIACRAMEEGKHVLVEKPLAISLPDARRIIATRDETGQVATVNFMLRFNPVMDSLWQMGQDGVFGVLRRVVVENYAQDEGLPPEHWFWDREVSGGILVEHAVHFLDLIDSLTAARHLRVAGAAFRRETGQEDRVMATVLYDDGLMATHYHAFARPGIFEHTSIRLVYDLAQIEVDGWIPLKGRITALVNGDTEPRLASLPGFRMLHWSPASSADDDSRPEGWGLAEKGKEGPVVRVRSGGVAYDVEALVEGTFDLGQPKGEVYTACLRALMSDLLAKVRDPGHTLRVTLEDGLSALETALAAWADAHKRGARG